MRKDGILAGAQQEGLLQQVDALAHCHAARKRPEVMRLPVERTAMKRQTRKLVAGQADVRVRLVVAEEDVVLGREFLDQRVFEDQRLGLGARGGDFDIRHLLQHEDNARALAGLLEVG